MSQSMRQTPIAVVMTTGVKFCEINHKYIKEIRHYKEHCKLNYIIGLRSEVSKDIPVTGQGSP
jgi:hypothetical protein